MLRFIEFVLGLCCCLIVMLIPISFAANTRTGSSNVTVTASHKLPPKENLPHQNATSMTHLPMPFYTKKVKVGTVYNLTCDPGIYPAVWVYGAYYHFSDNRTKNGTPCPSSIQGCPLSIAWASFCNGRQLVCSLRVEQSSDPLIAKGECQAEFLTVNYQCTPFSEEAITIRPAVFAENDPCDRYYQQKWRTAGAAWENHTSP